MNAMFQHMGNSEGKVREYLIESCHNQIENYVNETGRYGVLESLSSEERKEYVLNFQASLIGDQQNMKRVNNAAGFSSTSKEIFDINEVWKLVINIDFPKLGPITDETVEKIQQQALSGRYRMPTRYVMGKIWTDKDLEKYRKKVTSKPLP